ncbi:MAG TPA: tetratricopeptide repeat protein [Gaiellaceae bacterium]|jgi:tetratricopeptide (TPR) repeat protein|nr:tetratricopeptide repeat protein [Gaiellaceae bacterium]
MRDTASSTVRRPSPEGLRLGDRLRQLRVAAGLTQSELAGDRFSKEYVSQIERGKTRPTAGTIEWLADRLGVDAGFLASGVATDERTRIEGALTRAEALYEAQEDEEAAEAFEPLPAAARSTGVPELQVRALVGSGLAKMRIGDHRGALLLLNEARSISEAEAFSDVERADVLLRLGGCRVQLNSIQTALGLLNEAMGLAERSGLPCDALKANILSWRARCWLIQRDYQAAKEDVERALELAHAVDDLRTVGAAYFQASLVADREGRWVLARNYAERAREAYAQLADRVHVGQLTNNLGGLNFLLGNTEDAIELLKEAFSIALEAGQDADAGRAVSSLAQVHLRTGDVEQAEKQARHAIELLDGRVDYVDETGNAHLVLGRALLEQSRLDEAEAAFAAAENSFGELGSASHRAASWMARGDLAARRGDHERAAELYRTAAEALQDVRF